MVAIAERFAGQGARQEDPGHGTGIPMNNRWLGDLAQWNSASDSIQSRCQNDGGDDKDGDRDKEVKSDVDPEDPGHGTGIPMNNRWLGDLAQWNSASDSIQSRCQNDGGDDKDGDRDKGVKSDVDPEDPGHGTGIPMNNRWLDWTWLDWVLISSRRADTNMMMIITRKRMAILIWW